MGQHKLVIERLTKVFEGANGAPVIALDGIDLAVGAREFAVIVGPSGCGKSTLLNIVGGLERATGGRVLVDGRAESEPGADRGMVFQGYSLFPWLTVRKNVEFGLRMRGVPKNRRAEIADHFIHLVELDAFRDALPKQLSGGMKQRAAIARTLANEPALLLMDEPFGALDAQTRVVMQEMLSKIARETCATVLFITHDIDEAILLGQRIHVMSRRPGTIRQTLDIGLGDARDHRMLVRPEFLEIKGWIMEMLWQESREAALGL